MSSSIETRHLTVSFGGTPVVSGVDLQVASGELVALVGRSGAGKSTLLHAIAGFDGITYTGDVVRPKNIGAVLQASSGFPWMTVRQNILFGLERLDREAREQRANEVLRVIGLSDKASRYPGQLSGGEGRRVAFGMSLAPQPEVLLLDEPFGALDALTRADMQRWLRDIRDDIRTTMLLVTHDIEEAIMLADKIIVMQDGHIAVEFRGLPPAARRQGRLSAECADLWHKISETLKMPRS